MIWSWRRYVCIMHTNMYACLYVYIYIHTHTHVPHTQRRQYHLAGKSCCPTNTGSYTHIRTYIHTYIHMSSIHNAGSTIRENHDVQRILALHMCMHMHIYIYIYIYIYTHTHVYTYIYMYIYVYIYTREM